MSKSLLAQKQRIKSTKQKTENESSTAHALQTVSKDALKQDSSCKPSKCILCSSDHSLSKCDQFTKKSIPERREFVKTKHLCFNRLGSSHPKQQWKSRYSCYTCLARHHTLLHINTNRNSNYSDANSVANNQMVDSSLYSGESNALTNAVTTISSHSTQAYGKSSGILLATAQVYVIGPQNIQVKVKALMDSCSQVSLITQRVFNQH